MYAIRHKETKEWLFGTDYREWPHIQRTSKDQALTFRYLEQAESNFRNRECNHEELEIVKVKLVEVGD